MTTKSKPKAASAPVTTDKPVVLTVTIFPLKHGKRPLVISGAPDGEMPVVRSGNFSEIHSLFDSLWLELIKRKPKVVTKPAVKTTQSNKKTMDKPADDKDGETPADESQDEAAETDATENEEANPEAVAELEESIYNAKSNVEDASDQLVQAIGETADAMQEPLPLIEGDPTAE